MRLPWPGELIHATAADWDDQLGALVYFRDAARAAGEFAHKVSKRKERIVLFDGEGLAVIRQQVAAHPTGPLFPTHSGKAWDPDTLWVRFRKLRNAVGNPRLTLYS